MANGSTSCVPTARGYGSVALHPVVTTSFWQVNCPPWTGGTWKWRGMPSGSWDALPVMINAVALVVSYFSGPMLNFGDFSRYGESFDAVKRGNFWGLPVNFLGFSLLTVVTASATVPVFGHLITDPVETVSRIDSTFAVVLGAFTFMTATIGINIVANFVSPAFDFSNVSPRRISWRMGGMIAAVGSIFITPWNLYNNPEVIHYTIDVLGASNGLGRTAVDINQGTVRSVRVAQDAERTRLLALAVKRRPVRRAQHRAELRLEARPAGIEHEVAGDQVRRRRAQVGLDQRQPPAGPGPRAERARQQARDLWPMPDAGGLDQLGLEVLDGDVNHGLGFLGPVCGSLREIGSNTGETRPA